MPQVSLLRTEAEQRIAAEWADARARLPGPAALRERAFRRFEASGLPHRRVEEWKYTDLRALMREAKPLARNPEGEALARARAAGGVFAGLDAQRVVIANGFLVPELSDLADGEPGLVVRDLFAFLADSALSAAHPLGQALPPDDIAVALNTAFMTGGVFLKVAEGAHIARPVHLVHAVADDVAAAVFPRSLVVVEPGARLTLIETFEGPSSLDYQVNAALEIIVGDDAVVERIRVNGEGDAALHLSSVGVALGRGAQYDDFTFTSGGAVTRNQGFLRCGGESARLGVRGANLLRGKQHADMTLVVDHAVGGCESREVFKSVLDEQSRAVFQGKIIVRPDAQKTDARMLSNALMLSPDAEADHKPELEIFADDVQCGHGATAGALDDDLKFYLMARGIPTREAETLLIQSFVGEAIDAVANEGAREAIGAAAEAWLRARA